MEDIDSMFYQLRVPNQDASFQRFFWVEDGHPCQQVIEYQMVHIFDVASSPSCGRYALRKTAHNYRGRYNTEVIDTVFMLTIALNPWKQCVMLPLFTMA